MGRHEFCTKLRRVISPNLELQTNHRFFLNFKNIYLYSIFKKLNWGIGLHIDGRSVISSSSQPVGTCQTKKLFDRSKKINKFPSGQLADATGSSG